MKVNQMKSIESIREALSKIVDEQIEYGMSPYSAELKIDQANKEVIFTLNQETLILLARDLMELSLKQSQGSHIHYDEVNILDEPDHKLVIVLK